MRSVRLTLLILLTIAISACSSACGLLPPAAEISGEEAATAARDAVPHPDGDAWQLEDVEAGPIEQLMPDRGDFEWARGLPADRWVWRVLLESRDPGDKARAIIDFADGTVYGWVLSIVDR